MCGGVEKEEERDACFLDAWTFEWRVWKLFGIAGVIGC